MIARPTYRFVAFTYGLDEYRLYVHPVVVGGHNVGNEYLGLSPRLGPWRDTHVRVTGPAVLSMLVRASMPMPASADND